MSGRRLKRQQSTISIYFEALSPRYFCCFGLCHAKTIGVFIFLFELITVIGFAAFLFYTLGQVQHIRVEGEFNVDCGSNFFGLHSTACINYCAVVLRCLLRKKVR
ncbi:hypothetical protein M3Y94_01174100 [Aphelenchoides besseyi]|nr:hypothetical protein M3Y94_01174100 [Aphelenchoides besseyi]